MPHTFTLWFTGCLLVLTSSLAQAQLNLSITFSPTFVSGADPHGLAASTWTMSFEVPDTYDGRITPGVSASQGTLEVAGSSGVDGTYSITSNDTGFPAFSFQPYFAGFVLFGLANTGPNTFSFAGITITDFAPLGSEPNLSSTPANDSAVRPSDFDGVRVSTAVLRDSFLASSSSGNGRFSFSNVPITATAIPEPGFAPLALGIVMGLIIACRRLFRPASKCLHRSSDRMGGQARGSRG